MCLLLQSGDADCLRYCIDATGGLKLPHGRSHVGLCRHVPQSHTYVDATTPPDDYSPRSPIDAVLPNGPFGGSVSCGTGLRPIPFLLAGSVMTIILALLAPGGPLIDTVSQFDLVAAGEVQAAYPTLTHVMSLLFAVAMLLFLSGLDDIDSGIINIAGSDLSKMNDTEKTRFRTTRMGYIFQSFNLLPVLTALENVEMPLLVSGFPEKEANQKAQEALSLVGLSDRAGHYPAEQGTRKDVRHRHPLGRRGGEVAPDGPHAGWPNRR